MYKDVFVGNCAKEQPKRILILGESHHSNAESTAKVMETYWNHYDTCTGKQRDASYRFFDYIVRTFCVDPERYRMAFWNKVYFGNYVEEPCGIRDTKAQKAIKDKRRQYNQSLFEFIRQEQIDYVFCFSRRVYNALPQLERQDSTNWKDGSDAHRLEICTYHPGQRKNVDVVLDKSVTVFGLRHTSQGYSYRKYQEKIVGILKKKNIWQGS